MGNTKCRRSKARNPGSNPSGAVSDIVLRLREQVLICVSLEYLSINQAMKLIVISDDDEAMRARDKLTPEVASDEIGFSAQDRQAPSRWTRSPFPLSRALGLSRRVDRIQKRDFRVRRAYYAAQRNEVAVSDVGGKVGSDGGAQLGNQAGAEA